MRRRWAGLFLGIVLALAACGQTPAQSDATNGDTNGGATTPSSVAIAAEGPRVALIIANAAYQGVPRLKNPLSDAVIVAKSLRESGFEVFETRNAGRTEFIRTLQNFRDRADASSVAIIYYAGHGLEVGGRNWLIPTDATLRDERDLAVEAVDLDGTVLSAVEGAKGLRIVVLDACRDNPFARSMRRISGTRAIGRGLAEIEVSDTLVVYAARAGSTASDGDGANSPFAQALANRLREPGVDVQILFRRVRDDVLRATDNKQEPYQYGSLRGDALYIVPPPTVASAPPPVTPAPAVKGPFDGRWAAEGADCDTAMALKDEGDVLKITVAGSSLQEPISNRAGSALIETSGAYGSSTYHLDAGRLVLSLDGGQQTRFVKCAD